MAGNGSVGSSGDGGLAILAKLKFPSGVAVDTSGNFYIADTGNNKIRKVTSAGIITTVAGIGGVGDSGDGGSAILAKLKAPEGVAVDISGSLYIADTGNNKIRKVTGGIITTVAGLGGVGDSGDGGSAILAKLQAPKGVAVDISGSFYIADTGNNKIRKVTGGIITTVAGLGGVGDSGDGGSAILAKLKSPEGVAIDISGNLYIADTGNSKIRMVTSGIITTVAGNGNNQFSGDGGPAILAELKFPEGVAVDISGSFYIADTHNMRIRFVDTSSPSTFAPSSEPSFKPTSDPSSAPTNVPTYAPTIAPTDTPSAVPTAEPSFKPSSAPQIYPSSPKCEETRKI